MKVEFISKKDLKDIEVIIKARNFDDRIQKVVSILESIDFKNEKIIGERNEKIYFLNIDEIYSVYAQDKNVFLKTKSDEFLSKDRLYQLEEKLSLDFVRISKSVLVNINKIKSLEADFNGKMILHLLNNEVEYTSRSYLKNIKEKLGLK